MRMATTLPEAPVSPSPSAPASRTPGPERRQADLVGFVTFSARDRNTGWVETAVATNFACFGFVLATSQLIADEVLLVRRRGGIRAGEVGGRAETPRFRHAVRARAELIFDHDLQRHELRIDRAPRGARATFAS
jgi:hypothetical protein